MREKITKKYVITLEELRKKFCIKERIYFIHYDHMNKDIEITLEGNKNESERL